ncbi:hypothetical protein AAG570_010122 [Ranatra chinensis]|uniref:Uncharacterized protein n=1 Tax=Ranatra chinensis TaxID=642074 RepID=A0ABD0YLP1_9HEMI
MVPNIVFITVCKDTRGAYRYCGGGACIYKEYFEDRVFNCPYKDCLDENGCSVSVTMDGMDSGFELNTRVTVTATTSIFLSFFLFLGCIWLCRYFDMLCWSAGPAPPSSEASPSAPTTPSPDSHDKDLPPAYETLFPDR